MTKVAELYGCSTAARTDWPKLAARQKCPFLERKCLKNRKSRPDLTIGTCSMTYGKTPVMICPYRLLERNQIFTDCIHLLGLHEPGNELRIIGEVALPGGSVDYCLVSSRDGKVKDFVGIELQTLDTTGTVWPERQRFLQEHGVKVKASDSRSDKPFGMNWKMTAKTILVQLNHKIETFEHLGKKLVLVTQDALLTYIRKEFSFSHIKGQRDGDSMQFHSYTLKSEGRNYSLGLRERLSTDAIGIARALGLQATAKVDLVALLGQLEAKLPSSRLLSMAPPVAATSLDRRARGKAQVSVPRLAK